MRVIPLLRDIAGVSALAVCELSFAVDKFCSEPATPLSDGSAVALSAAPLVNMKDALSPALPLINPAGGDFRGRLGRVSEPLKQVPIDDAINEAKSSDATLKFSPAELKRQQNSKACVQAYDKLLTTFLPMRQSFGLGGLPADVALTQFVAWWLAPERTAAEKAAAGPVINAQREFDSACLSNTVPTEMDADAIRASVGVLVFNDQPVCIAFRTSPANLLTARHCFVSSSGELMPMSRLLHNKSTENRLWFQYEAEPANRYEVCRSSIPQKDEVELHPERDRIRLTVAAPSIGVPKWEWTDAKPGQSLYVRGYFPFGTQATLLERLRSSSSGGCAALVVKGKCVLNGCQSLPLTSGAPVFLRPEPGETSTSLKLVGLHLGSSSYSDTVAPAACPNLKPTDLPSGNFAFEFREN